MSNKSSECGTMTIVEAGKRLGIGRSGAYEAAHRGEIPTIKIGRRLLVPVVALNRLLNGDQQNPRAA